MTTTTAPTARNLDELAAWPKTEDEATAAAVRRTMLVYAVVYRQRTWHEDGVAGRIAAAATIAYHNVATLLGQLAQVDAAAADAAAREIWSAAGTPHAYGTWDDLEQMEAGLAQQVLDATEASLADEKRRNAARDAERSKETTSDVLPPDGTVRGFRVMVAKHAAQAEREFGKLAIPTGRKMTEAEFTANVLASHAALYGWSVACLLRFIQERIGTAAALDAALMIHDMGENGGADLCDDLLDEETGWKPSHGSPEPGRA